MTQFNVIPPLSWDNPLDVPILEHIEKTRGTEIAELVTLPDKEYLQGICELLVLNDHDDDNEDIATDGILERL
jgi:hypothetical protein